VGTDDDTTNFAISIAARRLKPGIFVIVRRNLRANQMLFARFGADMTMVSCRRPTFLEDVSTANPQSLRVSSVTAVERRLLLMPHSVTVKGKRDGAGDVCRFFRYYRERQRQLGSSRNAFSRSIREISSKSTIDEAGGDF